MNIKMAYVGDMSEPTTPPWESAFRHRMKARRDQKFMTQAELASRVTEAGLPFHQQTIQRVESGTRPIRLNEAAVIADVLKAKLADMMRPETPDSAQAELSKALRFLVMVSETQGVSFEDYAEDLLGYVEDAKNAHDHYLKVCETLGVHPDKALLDTYAEDLRLGQETAELFIQSCGAWLAITEAFPGKTEIRGWQNAKSFSWNKARGLDA